MGCESGRVRASALSGSFAMGTILRSLLRLGLVSERLYAAMFLPNRGIKPLRQEEVIIGTWHVRPWPMSRGCPGVVYSQPGYEPSSVLSRATTRISLTA